MKNKKKRTKQKIEKADSFKIEVCVQDGKDMLKLQYLPTKVRRSIRRMLKHNAFWNFSADCKYLKAKKADFHLTGALNPPGWFKNCRHEENRKKTRLGECDEKVCPLKTKCMR